MKNKITTIILALFLTNQISAQLSESSERADIYIEALQLAGQKTKLKPLLDKEIRKEKQLPRLIRLVRIAQDQGFSKLAELGYAEILTRDPENVQIHKELGVINYYRAEYYEAMRFIKSYIEGSKSDYQAHYIYADSAYQLREYEVAETYLDTTLKLIDQLPKPTLRDMDTQARTLSKLLRVDEAIGSYEKMLRQYPLNIELRLNYIDLLINVDQFNDAREQLALIHNADKTLHTRFKPEHFIDGYADIILASDLGIRYNLTCVRLYSATNKVEKAYNLIRDMLVLHPQNAIIMGTKADIYLQLTDKRNSFDHFKKASLLDIENKYYIKRLDAVQATMSSFTSDKMTYKTTETSSEFKNVFTLQYNLNDNYKLGLKAELSSLSIDSITDKNGNTRSYNGVSYRNELYLERLFDSVNTMKFSLYTDMGSEESSGMGLGTKYTNYDFWGQTSYELNYHKPYFGTSEAQAKGGNRDSVIVSRSLRYFESWFISATMGYQQYNIADIESLGHSYTYQLFASYHIPQSNFQRSVFGRNSDLFMTYAIDGESIIDTTTKTSSLGVPFDPLLLEDRHVHAIAPMIRK